MEKNIWKSPKEAQILDEAQTPLWFWNDKLETEELKRQLKLQTEIGVKCTDPHARPNNGEGYIGGYLDDEWFGNIRTTLEYKKEHGEKMWLYDELAWPAGTCNLTIPMDENYREWYILIRPIEIPAGEVFRAQIKTFEDQGLFGIRPETDKSGLAYNIHILDKETMEEYPVEDYFTYLMFGPELEFQSDRDCIAFITKVSCDLYTHGGSGQVNYMNADATKAFIESTHEKYYENFGEDFGKTITCIFNDETRMCHSIPWSSSFAETFRELKGYDIRKEIYQIILPGEKPGRIRCDYFDVVAYMYQNNYFGVLHQWCQEHNIRLFAHLLAEETVYGHTRYSGDYLRQNKYQDVCGADHLGKGIGSLNIKYTSAGAHSYGKKRTAVEVFAGCGWDLTFDEYTRMITWMYQQGMQIIINHGFFYSDREGRKNDWPPSQFFQWQGWDRQSEGNDMIRRLHYAMTDGINEQDVLVYFPQESFWLHYLPDQNHTHGFFQGPFLKDERAAEIDQEVQLILNGLTSRNMDFDIIHKDAAENFAAAAGKIENTMSGQKFSVLALPMCELLPLEVAELCRAYARDGGKIAMIGARPHLAMNQADDEKVKEIFDQLEKDGAAVYFETEQKEEFYQFVSGRIPHPVAITEGKNGTVNNHPAYHAYMEDPYLHTGEDISGVMFVRYLKEGKRNTLFMNYGDTPETIEVSVESSDVPEVWDTFTGEIKTAEVVGQEGNVYRIRLELPCTYGIFVVSSL